MKRHQQPMVRTHWTPTFRSSVDLLWTLLWWACLSNNVVVTLILWVQNKSSDPGPDPPNYLDKQKSFHPPVLFDHAPLGKNFGDVHKDAASSYSIVRENENFRRFKFFDAWYAILQNDTVEIQFWAGNPRNNLMVSPSLSQCRLPAASSFLLLSHLFVSDFLPTCVISACLSHLFVSVFLLTCVTCLSLSPVVDWEDISDC